MLCHRDYINITYDVFVLEIISLSIIFSNTVIIVSMVTH